jgi:hypothetical protein
MQQEQLKICKKTPWTHNTNTGKLKTGHFKDHVKREGHGDLGITIHTYE